MGRLGRIVALVLPGLMTSGCLWLAPAPRPAPAAEVLDPVEADVRVSLLWSDPVDLDLYVTDPELETVYFANTPSGSGGILAADVQCSDVTAPNGGKPRVETVYWTRARPGRYRIGVDFIDACGSGRQTTEFRVVVEAGGSPAEKVAEATLERFAPIVLEFDVPPGSGEHSAPEASP